MVTSLETLKTPFALDIKLFGETVSMDIGTEGKMPEALPLLLNLLPDTVDARDRVKKLLDQETLSPRFHADWKTRVREWLMMNSRYFREELVLAAGVAKDDEGWVKGKDDLNALARLDWQQAEPLLKRLAASDQARTAALALSLLYTNAAKNGKAAQGEEYRARLKSVVTDRKAPASARDTACETLLKTDWKGREEWYLSLFADETLRNPVDGNTMYSPLATPVALDPERWIPLIAKQIGHKNRAIHDAAVSCLAQFHLGNARKDALQPLLPWLFDPKWSSARDRLRLIQSLEDLDMPESVPGLIHVVEFDDDDTQRAYAAESLAAYRDPRAVPALKKALAKEKDSSYRTKIINALVVCGGLTDIEAVSALEAYAAQMATPQGRERFERYTYDLGGENSMPAELSIGHFLSGNGLPREELTARLLARATELRQKQPGVAKTLLDIVHSWPANTVDLDIVKRIAESTADASAIAAALQRRDALQQNVGQSLQELTRKNGRPRGIALVLLRDHEGARVTLEGTDQEAQRALLACARLVREPLPIALVGKLLNGSDRTLALAAETYLESEDSADARQLVLAAHPGEALILGARQGFDPGHGSFPAFDQLEDQMRGEVRQKDGPDEIYALLSAGYWGSAGQMILRVRQSNAELFLYSDPARYRRRILAGRELQTFKSFIAENRVVDLAPLNTMVHDGVQYEFVHLTKDGGRRVYMNNPGVATTGGSVYSRLVHRFVELEKSGQFTTHYRLSDRVKGLEVFLADDKKPVNAVWKSGAELRVLTGSDREETLEWRSFTEGKLGERAAQPDGFFLLGARDGVPEKMEIPDHLNSGAWESKLGKFSIQVGTWKQSQGIWKLGKEATPVKLVDGNCALPIVTPDGRWLVAAKTDTDWSKPNYIIRMDLVTGKIFKLDAPAADTFVPVAFIPAHNRVLLLRAKDELVGSSQPEHRLLDPATGHTEIVAGQFAPWSQRTYRPLQRTANPNEAWVALYNEQKEVTEVGRYDTKRFVFTPTAAFPEIRFDSMQMWVDEAEGRIYLAYHGHLLRLPLRQ